MRRKSEGADVAGPPDSAGGKVISVALIEDNQLVREGLVALLAAIPDVRVVAAESSADTTLLRNANAQVVLLDLGLRNGDSLQLAQNVRKDCPETRIVVMDLLPAPEEVSQFLQAGVAGFIMKDAAIEDLVQTIRSAAEGGHILPAQRAATLLSEIAKEAVVSGRPDTIESVRLTQGERAVIGLMAEGLTDKDIAARLEMATHTVRNHCRNVMEKLALHTRLQVAAEAYPDAVLPTPSAGALGGMLPDDAVAVRIPVLLVEDNRLLREGIVSILRAYADLDVAVAESADTALRHLTEVTPPPRVVLMDSGLAGDDTSKLVERIIETVPGASVIVMDLVPGPEDLVEFIQAGASGFIMKDATIDVFVTTIRRVATGEQVLPPVLTGTLFSHIAQQMARRASRRASAAVRLTQREQGVIGLLADGLSNKEIAQRIHLSPHTVKCHVRNILEKLALNSRLQVAAYVHDTKRETESS
ncbi:MAG: response regulator transcription factor [Gemmatimonadales bacterium]